jgi:hypothetical protein
VRIEHCANAVVRGARALRVAMARDRAFAALVMGRSMVEVRPCPRVSSTGRGRLHFSAGKRTVH